MAFDFDMLDELHLSKSEGRVVNDNLEYDEQQLHRNQHRDRIG